MFLPIGPKLRPLLFFPFTEARFPPIMLLVGFIFARVKRNVAFRKKFFHPFDQGNVLVAFFSDEYDFSHEAFRALSFL